MHTTLAKLFWDLYSAVLYGLATLPLDHHGANEVLTKSFVCTLFVTMCSNVVSGCVRLGTDVLPVCQVLLRLLLAGLLSSQYRSTNILSPSPKQVQITYNYILVECGLAILINKVIHDICLCQNCNVFARKECSVNLGCMRLR